MIVCDEISILTGLICQTTKIQFLAKFLAGGSKLASFAHSVA